MPLQRRVKYPQILRGLSNTELKARLKEDLEEIYFGEGSSSHESYISEDELDSELENSWRIVHGRFCYGSNETKDYRRVRYTSDIPINDKVLTRNGSEVLTEGNMRVIKLLSNLLVNSNLRVVECLFDCVTKVAQGSKFVQLRGDRPFPYYYSSQHPTLKGYVFHTVAIHGNGRVATFVKLSSTSPDLPASLRSTLLYLLPISDAFAKEAHTRFLPLDWQPSLPIEAGEGSNIDVCPYWLSTTAWSKDRDREEAASWVHRHAQATGVTKKIEHVVLEVCDGVIEERALDRERYDPVLVEQIAELGGRRVAYYIPIIYEDDTVRFVYRRLKKYQKLLRITGGTLPATLTDLSHHLRVTVPELFIAAVHDVHVRQCIPEPNCFLGSKRVCGQRHGANCPLLNAVAVSGKEPEAPRVCHGSDDERAGVPVSLIMDMLYTYVPLTRSYYSINRPVDKPVSITSDGVLMHFTESDLPVPVISTPYGRMAGGQRRKFGGANSRSQYPRFEGSETDGTEEGALKETSPGFFARLVGEQLFARDLESHRYPARWVSMKTSQPLCTCSTGLLYECKK